MNFLWLVVRIALKYVLGHSCIKGTVSRDFFPLDFLWINFPPAPEYLDHFKFFRKFAEIFATQGAPPVSMTPVANLPPVSNLLPVDTGGKIAAGINNTGGKFATSVNDTCGKIMGTVSGCWDLNFYDWRFFPFAAGVPNTGGTPWAANISANLRKNSKLPQRFTQGLGGNWFMKKNQKSKISWHCPFKTSLLFKRAGLVYVLL